MLHPQTREDWAAYVLHSSLRMAQARRAGACWPGTFCWLSSPGVRTLYGPSALQDRPESAEFQTSRFRVLWYVSPKRQTVSSSSTDGVRMTATRVIDPACPRPPGNIGYRQHRQAWRCKLGVSLPEITRKEHRLNLGSEVRRHDRVLCELLREVKQRSVVQIGSNEICALFHSSGCVRAHLDDKSILSRVAYRVNPRSLVTCARVDGCC